MVYTLDMVGWVGWVSGWIYVKRIEHSRTHDVSSLVHIRCKRVPLYTLYIIVHPLYPFFILLYTLYIPLVHHLFPYTSSYVYPIYTLYIYISTYAQKGGLLLGETHLFLYAERGSM